MNTGSDPSGRPAAVLPGATPRGAPDEEIAALRAIVEGTARNTGEAFFQSLVRHLAEAVGVGYAFVAEFDGEANRARTLAYWGKGAVAEKVPLGKVLVVISAFQETGRMTGDRGQEFAETISLIPPKYQKGFELDVKWNMSAVDFKLTPQGDEPVTEPAGSDAERRVPESEPPAVPSEVAGSGAERRAPESAPGCFLLDLGKTDCANSGRRILNASLPPTRMNPSKSLKSITSQG
jgi:hypothetical protein